MKKGEKRKLHEQNAFQIKLKGGQTNKMTTETYQNVEHREVLAGEVTYDGCVRTNAGVFGDSNSQHVETYTIYSGENPSIVITERNQRIGGANLAGKLTSDLTPKEVKNIALAEVARDRIGVVRSCTSEKMRFMLTPEYMEHLSGHIPPGDYIAGLFAEALAYADLAETRVIDPQEVVSILGPFYREDRRKAELAITQNQGEANLSDLNEKLAHLQETVRRIEATENWE